MDLKLLTLIVLKLITDINAIIRPSATLSIMNGEGFVAYLEVPKSFGAIKNCWYKFRDETKVKIDLNSKEPTITAHGEVITPFETTICGIRVNKVSMASAAVWTLEAENVFGDFEQDHVTINIISAQKTRFDTRISKDIGEGTISCSKHDSYTKHCKILEDNGDISNTCETFTAIRPNRTFECLMYNWGRLEESHEYISVDIKDSTVYTVATMEETNSSFILRCQFKDTLYSCQAEMPDHKKEIYIMDGLYNGRYSTYDTSIKQSRCSLEIPKPLAENERGLWRIINYDKSFLSGCLFYVGKNKNEIIEEELESTVKVKQIKIYEPENDPHKPILDLSYMVPYVISDCYLKDPNNTVYFPDNYRIQRQSLLGRCDFVNMRLMPGFWTCGVRGRDYEKEVLQEVEVIVQPRTGEVLTDQLKTKRSDLVELMCISAFEEPLSHCAFIDPRGRVHLVGTENSIKTAGHVKYFGRGLIFGECGAKIENVIADDFGEWKCQFVRYSGRATSIFSIQLKESATAHATSVGLGIGITIIILLVLGVFVGTIFYRRRNMSARHNFQSEDPLHVSTNAETTSTL